MDTTQLLGEAPIVSIRGMPFDASLEDIVVFFDGVRPIDVAPIYEESKKGNMVVDCAIVLFANMRDVDLALRKHKTEMGSRYVNVNKAKREEYYRAVSNLDIMRKNAVPKRKKWTNSHKKYVIRISNLPWDVSHEDIVRYFEGIVKQLYIKYLITY